MDRMVIVLTLPQYVGVIGMGISMLALHEPLPKKAALVLAQASIFLSLSPTFRTDRQTMVWAALAGTLGVVYAKMD